MFIVQVINEHQRSFQISTQEASQSMLLNMMNVQWCQNNFIISLCFCFWKSSNFCSQSNKEKVRLFPFFASGSTETCFWTTRKGIKMCCLDLWSSQVVTHSLSTELSLGWEHSMLCIRMTAETLSVVVFEDFFLFRFEDSLTHTHTHNWSYHSLCLSRLLWLQPLSELAPRLLSCKPHLNIFWISIMRRAKKWYLIWQPNQGP